MSERPSGTVTFLTTDIEGSTRLWQTHHEAMKTALADHDRLVRTAIETHGGYVFSTAGDSFWAAFTHPVDAALAALDTHQAITGHDWGDIGGLKVRAALDTGLADERAGDYFGPPLNRASRIMKHAHGGDTLCSHTTADLLKHDLPLGYQVAKVGRRRLRDVEETETLDRISTTSDTTRPTRWIPAAAVVAVVAAVGVGSWATSGGGDGTTTTTVDPTISETPTSSGNDPTGGILWSVPVGDIVAGPLILGDMVVTATNNSVSTLDLANGNLLWELDGFDRVRTLDTDGDYLFVTSVERLDVIHPSTGVLVPRCGFHLPVTFARTNVTEGDIHIMTGSLYRVVTNPGGQRCHGPVIENAGTMSGLDPTAGPVHTGRVVVAADAVGVYAFDPATLDLLWRDPNRSEPAITVHPPSLVADDHEERVRTNATASTLVALTDDTGILVVLEATGDGVRPVPLP
ncbi:MAG TPA: adenylate/guanylate cyclase domain-containing protein, partial [Acidimicrobiia bacterium]